MTEKYSGRISDSIRIAALIREILLIQPNQITATPAIDTQMIQVSNSFQSLFRTNPIDIALVQDTYYIEFLLDDIRFVLAYNIQTNTS